MGNSISNFTSSSSSHASGCSAIDSLIKQTAVHIRWIDITDFTAIRSSPETINGQTVIKVANGGLTSMLLLLGSAEKCTTEYISELARVHLILTRRNYTWKTIISHFRRFSIFLNFDIEGFTKYYGNYYLVADQRTYDFYCLYGFCPACGLLRCSPVWCICGHKEVFDGWTSKNRKLDEFIKKSQLQTNSANDAYLEWIPFDFIEYDMSISSPAILSNVKLIPLEITDETDYDKVNY